MKLLVPMLLFGFLAASANLWLNRGSEKIITAYTLGLAAVFAASLSVMIFGAPDNIRTAVGAKIVVDKDTFVPLDPLGFSALPSEIAIQIRDHINSHPDLKAQKDGGLFLYHHALQRGIVAWLQEKYVSSWQTEIVPLTIGDSGGYHFSSKPAKSRVFSADEVSLLLGGNVFRDTYGPFGPKAGLAVPPNTRVEMAVPTSAPPSDGIITLTNRYCTIKIVTSSMSWGGIGSYGPLLGLTEEQVRQRRALHYGMIITVVFTRYLSGNPNMIIYRKWSNDIVAGLASQFDEQAVWPRARDHYLMTRLLRVPGVVLH